MHSETYKRPWWLVLIKMPLLTTTVQENHRGALKYYKIEGKPEIKSVSWVVYGPILAAAAVLLVASAAWMLDINQADRSLKLIFVCLLGTVPIITWVITALLVNKLSQKPIARLAETEAVSVEIKLDETAQTLIVNDTPAISFADITAFKLVSDAGVYYSSLNEGTKIYSLAVETLKGQFVILPQNLGSLSLKLQLLSQLEASVFGD